jgi:hypothetical protein
MARIQPSKTHWYVTSIGKSGLKIINISDLSIESRDWLNTPDVANLNPSMGRSESASNRGRAVMNFKFYSNDRIQSDDVRVLAAHNSICVGQAALYITGSTLRGIRFLIVLITPE